MHIQLLDFHELEQLKVKYVTQPLPLSTHKCWLQSTCFFKDFSDSEIPSLVRWQVFCLVHFVCLEWALDLEIQ